MIPKSHIFVFEDDLPEMISSVDEKRYPFWHIGEKELSMLDKCGIKIFNNLIIDEEKTELEKLCFKSIKYYTKAISYTDYYDRLVQIITSLEILLLKDRNELIQDNVGRRLAFLTDTAVESRLAVIKLLKRAYEHRGSYLHHGKTSSIMDILKELQLKIWTAIEKTVGMTSKFKTKSELIEHLEYRILSG